MMIPFLVVLPRGRGVIMTYKTLKNVVLFQYLKDIVKKMKDSPGEIKFSLEDMEDDEMQDEVA